MPPKLDGLLHTAGATKSPIELVHIAKRYAADLPPRPSSLRPRDSHKDVVLVTGTTGNFGCDLLESMLRDESVAFVYALNRHNSNAPERQTSAFLARGFDIALLASSRYRLVEGDLNARGFGLDPSLLDEIRSSVTCIIHNAWQVDFNVGLGSFRPFFKSIRQLVEIALSSSYTQPPKIQFISSNGVFQSGLSSPILEEPIPAASALGYGYPESKWIGEQILLAAHESTGVPVQVVRLGQTCGDRNGHWNETEWLPLVIKSGLSVRCLPDMDGDAAFVPNHAAARAVLEMRSSPHLVLHLVHPRPIRLRAVMAVAARALDVPLVPYAAWLERLAGEADRIAQGNDAMQMVRRNPALALLGFFSSRSMAAADEPAQLLPVSTAKAAEASPTLAGLPQLDEKAIVQWMAAWRASGFLDE